MGGKRFGSSHGAVQESCAREVGKPPQEEQPGTEAAVGLGEGTSTEVPGVSSMAF